MKVRPYNREYYKALCALYTARNAPGPTQEDEIPTIGSLVMEGNEIVAAGFLRRLEGNYAHYDGMITNPEFSSAQRWKALNMLDQAIIKDAKTLGILALLAYPKEKSTLDRSYKLGFKPLPEHTLIILNLQSEIK